MGRLDSKVAFITGSTRGLGEAMARRFATEGAAVAVTGRNESDGERVAKEIRTAGGRAEFVRLDLNSEESVKAALDTTVEKFGKLNVLVNNAAPTDLLTGAGTDQEAGSLATKTDNMVTELTTEQFRRVLTPMVDGIFWTLHYGIPYLQKSGGPSSIINISSTASLMGTQLLDCYTFAKGGLNALTRSLAVEYAPHVRSNCLVAGPYATAGLKPVLDSPVHAKIVNDAVLAEKVGDPDLMAQAATFFASDESLYITGQVISVDGGYSVPMPMPKVEVLEG